MKRTIKVSVDMPKEVDGFMGRECPETDCQGYFKVKPGTGLTGPNLPCHCPYCGYEGLSDRFWTTDQTKYAQSVAYRRLSAAISRELKSLEFDHKPRGAFGIGIRMKFQPGRLPPIRHYREKALETHVTCSQCTLEYAVYGVFAYCPDCGVHNSLQMLQQNLDLARRQLLPAGKSLNDSSVHPPCSLTTSAVRPIARQDRASASARHQDRLASTR